MTQPIWKPTVEAVSKANLSQFINYCNIIYKTNFRHYTDLYQWSIDFPEQFWPTLATFCKVNFHAFCEEVLIDRQKMPGAQWFVGAKLNFAENLLAHRTDQLALIFRGENSARKTITYNELYLQVAQLAQALRNKGVTSGDRVGGWLPNCIETVVAMLATTSIGAIWSSCPTDFGFNGVLDRFGQIAPKILFASNGHFYNGKTFDNLAKVQELQQSLPSLEHTIIIPFTQPTPAIQALKQASLYPEFLDKNAKTINFASLPFDHPVYILYSSGTTGVPKCIVHGAGGTLLQHCKELVLHTDLTAQDTIFYFTTCGWMMWNWMISSLAVGATVVLYDGAPFYPDTKALFDIIDQERITVFGTGAKYIASVEKNGLKPIHTHSLKSLRTILSTGSPLAPESFDFVYRDVKHDLCLSSISGGTDIVSCFALGNPILPVYRGELQCRGLGMKVEIFNEQGQPVLHEKGELVCTAPFPCMPIYFWNDPTGEKYHKAYFEKYPGIWAHGDYAEITEHDGVIIYGRSDAVLNPGGTRIGTAEIYRQVEKVDEVLESLAIGQDWENDVRVILFVKLRHEIILDEKLKNRINKIIRDNASPRHVPAKIIQVADLPKTNSGKLVELAVRNIVEGLPVKNIDALANPESLEYFKNIPELQI